MNNKLKILLVFLILLALSGKASPGRADPDSPTGTEAGAPTVVSYQGQVTLGGSAYTGTGYFKFALVDQAGTTSFWSNDGTSSGGGAPSSAVSLTVTSGQFNVLLGDTTLSHMTALPATAFSSPDRYLRVWFSSGGSTFTKLSPDRRITAVPYALQAENAKTLNGSLSSAFANASHTHWGVSWSGAGTGLTLNSSNSTGLSASGTTYGVYGQASSDDGTGVYGLADATDGATNGVMGESASIAGYGVYGLASATSGYTTGVYGVTQSPDSCAVFGRALATTGQSIGVYGVSKSTDGVGVVGSAGAYGVYGQASSDDGTGVYGLADATDGATNGVMGESASIAGYGVYGLASATSGYTTGVYGVTHSPDSYAVFGRALATTGQSIGVYGVSKSTDGIGVVGSAGAYGVFGQADSTTGTGVWGIAVSTSGTTYGVYGKSDSSGGRGVYGEATAATGAAYGVYGKTASTSGKGVYGEATANSGDVTGTQGNSYSPGGKGVSGYNGATTGNAVGVYGQSQSNSGYGGYFTSSGVGVYARGSSGNIIEGYGSNTSDREFYVSNTGEVYADGTFHTPAADYAELLPAAADVQPGDVLVIGLDGKLTRSDQAYQSSVVGVYSTNPGFVGGDGGENAGKVPLAVVGVVPVKVSAENGAIRPGDLLTASNTPGHAMKASPITVNGITFYPSGVVIGKALEGLDSGTGVILVLVILQ